MEHYKSRNNDFFHFSNPHDDYSDLEVEEDDYHHHNHHYDHYYDDDDDDEFNFPTSRPSQPLAADFQKRDVVNRNDTPTIPHGALISEIDHKMRNLSEKLLCTIEGLGKQISHLEDKTCQLDKFVENVKNSAKSYHRMTNGKLRQIHNILQEVNDGVHFLKDKHEIAETQIQLAELRGAKRDPRSDVETNPLQLPLLSAPQPSCTVPYGTQFSNPLSPNKASSSQYVTSSPASSQPNAVQRYLIPPPHQPQYLPQLPHFIPHQLNSLQGVVTPLNSAFLSHHFEETPYRPSYRYPSSVELSPSQPAGYGPNKELEMALCQSAQVQQSRSYESEFLAKYLPVAAGLTEFCHYHEQPYSHESSDLKEAQFSQNPQVAGIRSNYGQLPEGQLLPRALPTVVNDASSSVEHGNTELINDIVEKVTAMGFRRDLVKATVRKLTENGSLLDLNMVVDTMINNK